MHYPSGEGESRGAILAPSSVVMRIVRTVGRLAAPQRTAGLSDGSHASSTNPSTTVQYISLPRPLVIRPQVIHPGPRVSVCCSPLPWLFKHICLCGA